MKPDFTKSSDGLIPAIIQDATTNAVLMLGYMNEEAFEKTEQEKRVIFYSRSKKRLWLKGEESGNFLNVSEIKIDCDNDTLLIKAKPVGAVCHTGDDTCFKEKNEINDFLNQLEAIIYDRKENPTIDSYTSKLFDKGINKIAQKVGEEAIELVIESKDNNKDLFLNEAADLLYHYMILLAEKGFKISDIIDILKKRNK